MRFPWIKLGVVLCLAAPFLQAASLLPVQMSGRVVTPNGDGINDLVIFNVQSSQAVSSHATVVNVQGRRVMELQPDTAGRYHWNGHDDSGRVVESGVYLVQIVQDTSLWNGIVAVAR